ncbi:MULTISPECIES: KAP family P-loop NTPase fold protein [unclassified Mesorhizobium]|uniref:KAP family P-loop NTPase fold protein n=1 Tax=unclassified Mesorhizobium TaxID=325217 RepID=UPI000F74EAB8|nr:MULTISPECIES: P-loop NTPase fold protein [unclassified Mesorhizobium]AZO68565.1 hypothetical protein EJ075_29070 [Mesorhizobium sp. M6A.T.Cr.TU.016.01.1.1]RWP53894.1 MAG: hypothetical protein EOR06_13215 [Mesorhizobium sp.]RWQ82683.1 MAG: hypothetical protein EOS85_12695 [Mesorhizobium sp.]
MAQELDRPIQDKRGDRLGRGPFVEQLTNALVDKNTEKSSGLIVSLIGAWGSGKSSTLNLLENDVRVRYPNSIVLRFDPWLIANRDDLVRQFLSDLGKILEKDDGPSAKAAQAAGKLLSDYDGVISAGIEATSLLPIPGLPYLLKVGKSALTKTDKTLHQLKADITKEMEGISYPIVVLIDEVDRLDDGEVLEIMRLVKAVADFPNVSYLIAYDIDRVVEALGASARNADDASQRGRSYLEKIVQHQVFLPALFEAELVEMFRAEVKAVVGDYQLPASRSSDEPYATVENAIFPNLIRTPRDLKRCIGIFRALYLMVGDEVSWIDLLGYATLLAKSPSLTERIKNDPIFFSSDFTRGGTSFLRYGIDGPSPAEQLGELLGERHEKRPDIKLLHALFPRFLERQRPSDDHSRIEHYRALSFLIRQGTPPGALPINNVRELFSKTNVEIGAYCDTAVQAGQFDDLNYILSYHYRNFDNCAHTSFWASLAGWCRKPDATIPTSHDPRVGYLEIIESTFSSAVSRSQPLAESAVEIVFGASSIGNFEFASRLLRNQVWAHGLFGKKPRSDFTKIGDAKRWEEICLRLGKDWKQRHLETDWFFQNWKESPVWFLLNVDLWDDACRQRLDKLTEDEVAFEALVMMVFGRHYLVEKSGVESLIGWDSFKRKFDRLEAGLAKGHLLPPDVTDAVDKVKDRLDSGKPTESLFKNQTDEA